MFGLEQLHQQWAEPLSLQQYSKQQQRALDKDMTLTTSCNTEGCDNFGLIITQELPEGFSTDVWCVCGELQEIKES
jgi:hypothetical protein